MDVIKNEKGLGNEPKDENEHADDEVILVAYRKIKIPSFIRN